MTATAEQPALFLVGSFPPQLPPETLKTMEDPDILRHTMGAVFKIVAPYLRFSAPDTESRPAQVDWEKYYSLHTLPEQEGVERYRWPQKLSQGKTLLSSPHFHLAKGLDSIPVGENDLGLRIYENASVGIQPFTDVTNEHGRQDLLYKNDVPEVGMSMVYFGLSTILTGLKGGLGEAIRHHNPRGFSKAFAEGLQTYEDKYRKPYQQATFNQIDKVLANERLRDRVEMQVSAPVSHGLTNLLYLGNFLGLVSDSFRDDATKYLASTVADTLNYIPADVSRVVHGCRGELHPDKFMGSVYHPSEKYDWSNRATVGYFNTLDDQTNAGHKPRLVHAVSTPASARAIADGKSDQLLMPYENWQSSARLAAGMIDLRTDVAGNVLAYKAAARHLGYMPDVALACGSGRQRKEIAGKKWSTAAMDGLLLSRAVLIELNGGEEYSFAD